MAIPGGVGEGWTVVHSCQVPGGSLKQKRHLWDLRSKVLWDHYSQTLARGPCSCVWPRPSSSVPKLLSCVTSGCLNPLSVCIVSWQLLTAVRLPGSCSQRGGLIESDLHPARPLHSQCCALDWLHIPSPDPSILYPASPVRRELWPLSSGRTGSSPGYTPFLAVWPWAGFIVLPQFSHLWNGVNGTHFIGLLWKLERVHVSTSVCSINGSHYCDFILTYISNCVLPLWNRWSWKVSYSSNDIFP